ncbi:MAG: ethanolamine-phosphate phospho-lyase [Limisphaerales bacterium]|jgi:ethanolamine-phosphate phospho-lyase
MKPETAVSYVKQFYNMEGVCKPLAGYDDQNFCFISRKGQKFVLKFTRNRSQLPLLSGQTRLLKILNKKVKPGIYPNLIPTISGTQITPLEGEFASVRMLEWIDGEFLDIEHIDEETLFEFGSFLGNTNKLISNLNIPLIRAYDSDWDLRHFGKMRDSLSSIKDPVLRSKLDYFFLQFEESTVSLLRKCRPGIIHGDANDQNVLFKQLDGKIQFSLIDFGDCCWSHPICDLAVALPYFLGKESLRRACKITEGFHSTFPLTDEEIKALYYLVIARAVSSIIMSAKTSETRPNDEYIDLHQQHMIKLIDQWIAIGPVKFERTIRAHLNLALPELPTETKLLERRNKHNGLGLSLAYNQPIHMTRASFQYMFDAAGNQYLDCVNNIIHVGHCHPHVVRAISSQAAKLNTNTRYFLDQLDLYSARIADLFPAPLNRVYFVNSGSEAGDLALRLARNYTNRQTIMSVDHGYHGNSQATIEASAYKYKSKGGLGKGPNVIEAPMPDIQRGLYKGSDAGPLYAEAAKLLIDQPVAAFICESIIGCGGQIDLPPQYLSSIYKTIREQGGLCIADEVQTGFYRVGSHWWAFERQNVVPDIVIMGKPMGNGHPLAAVITTDEIAQAFDNGMEFFSSFGGNPVSCAAGMAVLDIIETEKLGEQALQVGSELKEMLKEISKNHPEIGEIRGAGLFIGIDIVSRDHPEKPDGKLAGDIINAMRRSGILLSTDGPYHNVIKFKPPMCFTQSNAKQLCSTLANVLTTLKQ